MAQISGITQNARNAIVSALQGYERSLRTDVSYGVGNMQEIVKGEKAQAALRNLVNKMMNDFREEIAIQIDRIEQIAGNLESNYSKIDSNTTFTAKS